MAGAWEMRAQNSVLCAILHTDVTTVAWAFGLRNLIIPGQILPVSGLPYDHARNMACQQAVQGGFEWLFFLDSDVIPPRDTIVRLIAHQKPVISGMYCRRSPPHSVPVMMRNGTWVTDIPVPGNNPIVEVELVGAGCLLLHRSLLQALPPSDASRGKHWFDWRSDMAGLPGQEGWAMSEDFTMCRRIREQLKIPILVDTSIRCRHVGHCEADYGSLLPLTPHPVT